MALLPHSEVTITVVDDKDRTIISDVVCVDYSFDYPILRLSPKSDYKNRWAEVILILAPGYRVGVDIKYETSEQD